MPEEKKDHFPMISVGSWWSLREKFQKSIPATVTDTYLATSLGMKVQSAQRNVLVYLKQIGLVTEEGKPTDLVKQWRDDQEYSEVCQIIRQNCYPQELLDLFPGPEADAKAVSRWFMNHSGVGESSAGKQTSFFLLLTKADASDGNNNRSGSNTKSKTATKPANSKAPKQENQSPIPAESTTPLPGVQSLPATTPQSNSTQLPSLHIDIQIHIAPDTPAEQIDRIFASMAKHLQGMKGNDAE